MGPSSREINGTRLPPLKVHRDSHLVRSSSSSSAATTTSSNHPNRRHPVIIYTHSPKVIHTHASDFMALVQKLTGRSRSLLDEDGSSSDHPPDSIPPPPPPPKKFRRDCRDVCASVREVQQDEVDESSTSSENCTYDVHASCSTLSTAAAVVPVGFEPLPLPNPYLSGIPLFAASSSTSDYYCSPGELYRYPECSFPASVHNVAPSIMDVMGAYNDY